MTSRRSPLPSHERRWQRRPDERPRTLMESAMKLLLKRGYGRVSLDEVAADAGVSKATVYHYFSGKDDLLTRSLSQRMAEKQDEIERYVARAGGSAAKRLQLYLQEFWVRNLRPQAGLWQQMLVSEIAADAPEVFAAWARGFVARWQSVERLIRDGQRTGEFRQDADAHAAARTIMSSLTHQALFHVHLGMHRFSPYDRDRLCKSLVNQFLRGLRKHS